MSGTATKAMTAEDAQQRFVSSYMACQQRFSCAYRAYKRAVRSLAVAREIELEWQQQYGDAAAGISDGASEKHFLETAARGTADAQRAFVEASEVFGLARRDLLVFIATA